MYSNGGGKNGRSIKLKELPVYQEHIKWSAPKIKSKFKYLYFPLFILVGLSILGGHYVNKLEDKSIFLYPWGVQLASFMWLVVVLMSIVGTMIQIEKYSKMRKVITQFRLLGREILTAITPNTQDAKGKLITNIEVSVLERQPNTEFKRSAMLVSVQSEVEHIILLILLSLISFIWECTSPDPTIEEGEELINNTQNYPSHGFLLNSFSSNILGAGKTPLSEIFLDRLTASTRNMFQKDMMRNTSGTGNNLDLINHQILDLERSISDFQSKGSGNLFILNKRLYFAFSIATLIATPFLILPVTDGWYLVVVYSTIVLILGYFILLRYYIGDVFNDAPELYAIDINNHITLTLQQFCVLSISINDKTNPTKFEQMLTKYFSELSLNNK